MNPNDPLLFEHEPDGIQEHDHPAPLWLTRTFAACIVFAGVYFTWFHILHKGTTPQEDFQVAWGEYQQERKAAMAGEVIQVDEAVLASDAQNTDVLSHGRDVFVQRCTGCHTDNGRGLVGPNLTDDFQIHGHTRLDIYNTVYQGVADKGMPAWSEQLPQHDIVAVATFVTTLRGTNVSGGKAPQGDKVAPFTP